MEDLKRFSLKSLGAHPAMCPDETIQGDRWRIGILSDCLVRFEWSDDGIFEDRASQFALNRNFAHPDFSVYEEYGRLAIKTDKLEILYDRSHFSQRGLSVRLKDSGQVWHYGDVPEGNLGGTARTLDKANGEISVGAGVLSREGWATIDDSDTDVLEELSSVDGEDNPFGTWVVPRREHTQDLYLFAYGHEYKQAISDYYKLSGPTPLLPRFVFGNWWSRYHKYSEKEYLQLMDRFENEKIPFSTAVLDIDWHKVDIDKKYGSGWTGYSWNRELFPDPQRFLKELHRRGLKVTLNLHPADGVRAFEDDYDAIAQEMGIDPALGKTIEFDAASPKFMEAYLRFHHRMEEQGVDFWWVDWQQGNTSRHGNIDPLWMLNHMHYIDSGRKGQRPLTFSRYAGPGSHRYPIGFSGDTVVSWQSLRFQPKFTSMASNIGYGWWSHDIGGHMYGYRDEELEARWYQLGVFSPINRLHSAVSPFNSKEPWNFSGEIRETMTEALRLRHSLIPYLYSMNWRAADEGLPLVEPLYWSYPEISEAYSFQNEYLFGTELLVSPITEKTSSDTKKARTAVWFPHGAWFDLFTGRQYEAPDVDGKQMEVWRDIKQIPVFAKAGAIIPLQSWDSNSVRNPSELELVVFPQATNSFDLIEDDGHASTLDDASITHIENQRDKHHLSITHRGPNESIPSKRKWKVVFRGVSDGVVHVFVDSQEVPFSQGYDAEKLSLAVEIPDVPASSELVVELSPEVYVVEDRRVQDSFDVLFDSQMYYELKEKAYNAIKSEGIKALPQLYTYTDDSVEMNQHIPDNVIHALVEVLTRGDK